MFFFYGGKSGFEGCLYLIVDIAGAVCVLALMGLVLNFFNKEPITKELSYASLFGIGYIIMVTIEYFKNASYEENKRRRSTGGGDGSRDQGGGYGN